MPATVSSAAPSGPHPPGRPVPYCERPRRMRAGGRPAKDGGRGGPRLIARGALAAMVVGATVGGAAGWAAANDRTTDVVCVDPQTGAWRATMTFSSIEVHEGHPVVISFGSASTTLATPGP